MRSKFYYVLFTLLFCFGWTGFVLAQTNLLVNANLETVEPGFWNKMNDGLGGAQCIWSTDTAYAYNGRRSFEVMKPAATSDPVGWASANNADLYWNNAGGNDLYNIGFWAKTEGVNTAPANQDAMIGAWFRFYSGGVLLVEKFVGVDQTAAATDSLYTDGVLVPSEPDSVVIKGVMGKDATGTVWFDNFSCNTNAGWTMGVFNGDAETPVGWLQWASGSDVGFVAQIEDADAHSGTHDALLAEKDTLADEIVFYSEPTACDPGEWYLMSAWVKTDSINTGPEYYPTNVIPDRDNNRIGFTFFFHRTPLGTAWDLSGGDQFFYIDQRADSSGWTKYTVLAQAPEDAAGVSMRARYTSFPTGYTWYDDFSIKKVQAMVVDIENPASPISTLSSKFQLAQNYPNPFNPQTMIEFQVPKTGKVALNIYNMLGQKIRSLVNDVRQAGTYRILWDGRNDSGNRVATGIYLYQLKGNNALITKKMTFIK